MTTGTEQLENAIKDLKRKRAAAKRQQKAASKSGRHELALQLQERIQHINQLLDTLEGVLIYNTDGGGENVKEVELHV